MELRLGLGFGGFADFGDLVGCGVWVLRGVWLGLVICGLYLGFGCWGCGPGDWIWFWWVLPGFSFLCRVDII